MQKEFFKSQVTQEGVVFLAMVFLNMLFFCTSGHTQPQPTELENVTQPTAKIYRNPAERRESGSGTKITDWLRFSGLFELDKEYSQLTLNNGNQENYSENPTFTLQLGFSLEFDEWLEAQLIFDAEYDKRTYTQLDEGFIGVDIGNVALKLGKQYLPFGQYYSNFVIGPMLEVGETRSNALIIEYSISEKMEWSVFAFDANPEKYGSDRDYGWGASLDILSKNESLRFGASYVSELVNYLALMFNEFDSKTKRNIPAWSVYALFGFELSDADSNSDNVSTAELTLEIVQALRESASVESKIYKPIAANVELALYPIPELQFALRLEYSDELILHPQWKSGVSVTWRFGNNYSLSFDYLYGRYKPEFLAGDKENTWRQHQNELAGILVVVF